MNNSIKLSKVNYNLLSLMIFMYTLAFGFFDKEGYINYFYFINVLLYFSFFFIKFKTNSLLSYKYNYVIIIYFLYTIFCFFSAFWAIDFHESFKRSFSMLLIGINIMIVYNVFDSIKTINPVLWGFVVITIVNFFIGVGVFGNSAEYYDSWRFQGTRDNPNYLAVMMLFSIVSSLLLSAQKKRLIIKYILFINVVIAIYIIVLTASKKGIFFGGLLLLIYLNFILFRSKINFKTVIISLFSIGVFYFMFLYHIDMTSISDSIILAEKRVTEFTSGTGTSTNERIHFIQMGFNIFAENPLFGIGIGNFKVLYGTYSHNNFIEVLSGTGVIGFFIFYSIYMFLLYKNRDVHNKYIKRIILVFILILVVLDGAVVSYYYKFSIFMLIVMASMISFETKEVNKICIN